MTEGQSPSHFAKQLVRFLRNALVAKVAGDNSPLLQISSDERKKVGSVAALFSEEDLTRFLNIVLRTYDELGYRQEQRFHLELGMLKMVHAHRLLPLEELLSQSSGSTASVTGTAVRPISGPAISRSSEAKLSPVTSVSKPSLPSTFAVSGSSAASGRSAVSPFEADRLRKARSSDPELMVSTSAEAVQQLRPALSAAGASAISISATALAEVPEHPTSENTVQRAPQGASIESLRSALIAVLEGQSQETAADLLARGEWKLEDNQVCLRLPLSEKVIDLSLSADSRRLLTQEASRLCGRAMKLSVSGGGTPQNAPVERASNGHGNGAGGARQRAADDPIVNRMQQKFGAEVRTVVDLRQKK
jgi:DNA polymerase-3 subunit gamma/tau